MYLLEQGASKELKDVENNTALSIGLINEHLNIVTLLIHNNCDVNAKAYLVKRKSL